MLNCELYRHNATLADDKPTADPMEQPSKLAVRPDELGVSDLGATMRRLPDMAVPGDGVSVAWDELDVAWTRKCYYRESKWNPLSSLPIGRVFGRETTSNSVGRMHPREGAVQRLLFREHRKRVAATSLRFVVKISA